MGRLILALAALLALVALVAACGGPVRITVADARPRDQQHLVEPEGLPAPVVDACDLWGIACEADDAGPLELVLLPDSLLERYDGPGHPVDLLGRSRRFRPCVGMGVAFESAVAHELGHLLELGHVDDPRNVMVASGHVDARGVTCAQLDTAAQAAGRLATCP